MSEELCLYAEGFFRLFSMKSWGKRLVHIICSFNNKIKTSQIQNQIIICWRQFFFEDLNRNLCTVQLCIKSDCGSLSFCSKISIPKVLMNDSTRIWVDGHKLRSITRHDCGNSKWQLILYHWFKDCARSPWTNHQWTSSLNAMHLWSQCHQFHVSGRLWESVTSWTNFFTRKINFFSILGYIDMFNF